MNYQSVSIPKSRTNRVYHYGIRSMPYGHSEPITWFSDYGKHVHSSVIPVTDYICLLEMDDAMRKATADRIKFYRRACKA